MTHELIFGYGSLVNPATHEYGTLHPATLNGWRRTWHYTTTRDLAYLSVTPDSQGQIRGVILNAPRQDSALEHRERAYHRHAISHQTSHDLPGAPEIQVFAIPDAVHTPLGGQSALLLSYIDVVAEGYLALFGAAGVQEFFDTTHGWGAPVIDDRDAPIYPRYTPPGAQTVALVDDGLTALNATFIAA